MSTGLYSHTTRGTGTVLTASIYNSDHQNHITNQNPTQTGGYADNTGQYQTVTDPGGIGSESLPGSLAGEIERIRFCIKRITGKAQWYAAPATNLDNVNGVLPALNIAGSVAFAGDLSPAQITSNQNDYAPTGHANAFRFRLNTDAIRTITGLAGGAAGRIIGIENIGIFPIILTASDAASTAANRFLMRGRVVIAPSATFFFQYDSTLSRWVPDGDAIQDIFSTPNPQGYLTLVTGVPIQTGDQTAKTSVFYTPRVGNYLPIYNGAIFIQTLFAEMTLALVASHAASTMYDVYAFLDPGTGLITIGTGPAWSTSTAGAGDRGTGAGTAQIALINGIWTNAVSMTARNGSTTYTIAANQGTYLGSIFIDSAAGQVTNHSAYGQSRKWSVWNAYNRNTLYLKAGDGNASWSSVGSSFRPSNNAAANSMTLICGLPDEPYRIDFVQKSSMTIGANVTKNAQIGIGRNSTTTRTGKIGSLSATYSGSGVALGFEREMCARMVVPSMIGVDVITALERSPSASDDAFFGTEDFMGLFAEWRG